VAREVGIVEVVVDYLVTMVVVAEDQVVVDTVAELEDLIDHLEAGLDLLIHQVVIWATVVLVNYQAVRLLKVDIVGVDSEEWAVVDLEIQINEEVVLSIEDSGGDFRVDLTTETVLITIFIKLMFRFTMKLNYTRSHLIVNYSWLTLITGWSSHFVLFLKYVKVMFYLPVDCVV